MFPVQIVGEICRTNLYGSHPVPLCATTTGNTFTHKIKIKHLNSALINTKLHASNTRVNTWITIYTTISNKIYKTEVRRRTPHTAHRSVILLTTTSSTSNLKMEVKFSSEISVDFQRTTRHHIPEDRTFQNNEFSVLVEREEFLRGATASFSGGTLLHVVLFLLMLNDPAASIMF
jgi:hypothetical protein